MQWILDNWLLLLLGGGHGRGRDDGAGAEPEKGPGIPADKAETGRDG